jgi:hypothetical protein
MTRPTVYLLRMAIFLVLVAAIVFLLLASFIDAFEANPALNGLIVGVMVLGIIYIFRQVQMLAPEVDWIESYRTNRPGISTRQAPRMVAPMATMLGERQGKVSLSTVSMRSILDSIGARLDESRELSRYLIALLIFLGLLGTFWGLLKTIGSVGDVVGGLSIAEGGDVTSLFNDLKTGLAAPLEGMGTAFSSSLFGLAGSLVLGFLDLQANQAQNRFYNELEEWLSSFTRLQTGSGIIEADQSVPAYVSALLEQTADSLDRLQRTLTRGEESRRAADQNLAALSDQLATLSDQMRSEQALMVKLVEGQLDMKPVLERLANVTQQSGVLDEASRAHLRNMDVLISRLLEETINGRSELAEEIRSEIKLLARTIAATGTQQKG